MKYLLIAVLFLVSCAGENPKVAIVEEIKMYQDSIRIAQTKQLELTGGTPTEEITLENSRKWADRQDKMFTKNQSEIGKLDVDIMLYRAHIKSLELELKKY